jgi:hypothetical protein
MREKSENKITKIFNLKYILFVKKIWEFVMKFKFYINLKILIIFCAKKQLERGYKQLERRAFNVCASLLSLIKIAFESKIEITLLC